MSGYKLQENEIELKIPISPVSDDCLSCILSKPNLKYHPKTSRAAIIMHGLGAHKNSCYNSKLARKISKEHGIFVIRFDFRNCGDSYKTGKMGRTLQNDIEDINIIYNWLTNGGFEGKKIFVDSLIGHSRGVVDVFNWQLANPDKFVINLIACAGRFIGRGLSDSIRKKHPNFETEGGHIIQGFQNGSYGDLWVPLAETKSLSVLNMKTVKKINKDIDTLLVYGTRENVIPLEDAALYANSLRERNTLILIPGADHCFRGVDKIPEDELMSCGKPIIEKLGIIDYTFDVADKVAAWMRFESMNERFYEKHKNVHEFLPRFKNIQGVSNFRDIGGYTNKEGKVFKYNQFFRSGTLSNITKHGISELEKLKLFKVFDLSLPSEECVLLKQLNMSVLIEKSFPPNLASAVLVDEENILSYLAEPNLDWFKNIELYIFMIETIIPSLKSVFEYICDYPNNPVLFYCTLGKDCTGILTMILLLLAGIDTSIVVQEYCLSQYGFTLSNDSLVKKEVDQSQMAETYLENQKQCPEQTIGKKEVRGEVLLETIVHLETKYGCVEKYLETKVGLSESQISTLKSNLLQ